MCNIKSYKSHILLLLLLLSPFCSASLQNLSLSVLFSSPLIPWSRRLTTDAFELHEERFTTSDTVSWKTLSRYFPRLERAPGLEWEESELGLHGSGLVTGADEPRGALFLKSWPCTSACVLGATVNQDQRMTDYLSLQQ